MPVSRRVADPHDDADDDSLGRVLYFAHLAVLLVWLLEAGDDGDAAARAALGLCRDGLSWGGPFLKSPVTRLLLERLQTIVNLMTDEGGNRA